ncbi:MAG: hypothetical protein ACK4IC_05160 [Erythrobacter sp.]
MNSIRGVLARLGIDSRRVSAKQSEPIALHADDDLRVTRLGDPAASGLFICFTGIRQAMGGIGAEEFTGSTALPDFSALFVSDLKRTWYNGFPAERLTDILAPFCTGKRVVTVGNSMGGFGALWATTILPVDTAIAFAPQYSLHPELVPGETRWREFTEAITHFRYPSLADAFTTGARIFTINGDDDREHWINFPARPGCENVLIRNSGHDPARLIKQSGALPALLQTCLGGGSALALLRQAGLDVVRI